MLFCTLLWLLRCPSHPAMYNLMIFAFSPLTHGVIKVRTKVIKYWRQEFMDKTSNMRPSVLWNVHADVVPLLYILLSRFPRDILLPMGQMEMEKEKNAAVLQRVLFASTTINDFLSFFSRLPNRPADSSLSAELVNESVSLMQSRKWWKSSWESLCSHLFKWVSSFQSDFETVVWFYV